MNVQQKAIELASIVPTAVLGGADILASDVTAPGPGKMAVSFMSLSGPVVLERRMLRLDAFFVPLSYAGDMNSGVPIPEDQFFDFDFPVSAGDAVNFSIDVGATVVINVLWTPET